jgi:hypothetical protein
MGRGRTCQEGADNALVTSVGSHDYTLDPPLYLTALRVSYVYDDHVS